MSTLFPIPKRPTQVRNAALDQYFTPEWAAAELVTEFFDELGEQDLVIEPSCGRGAFLKALPAKVPVIGVEIDAGLAAEARSNSGREVICGDFRTVDLPPATAIIGNPPFDMQVFDGFLDRAGHLLREEGRCGFLLPAYAVQTPSRVLRWNETWALEQRIIPRTLFPRLSRPLVFLLFTKTCQLKPMFGFALYRKAQEVNGLPPAAKLLLTHGRPRVTCWRALVEWALRKLGGTAALRDIYAVIEPRRLSQNPWWQEKVRQQLQLYFRPVDRGVWALPAGGGL